MRQFLLLLLTLTAWALPAQTRISLLEEFTGEDCMPCAAYNPALDALMAKPVNASKMIVLKWQVPIPTVPANGNSLYQTNQAEINWRYRGSGQNGYGYQHQNTPTAISVDGIPNAPTCRVDGQNVWIFGAASNHPFHLNDTAIANAQAVSTPFSISMDPVWDASFSNCAVSVTVTASSAFSASGALKFRLCLVERRVQFTSPPGSNGETIFHDAVRKSYPVQGNSSSVTDMGTALPSAWSAAMMQTFTVNCVIPGYINDKSQMAFVGFIQDDGNKIVYQAQRTAQPPIPNNAEAGPIDLSALSCNSSVQPTVTVFNKGPNPITAFTITPDLDGASFPDVAWSGNLAPSTSTTLPLSNIPVTAGTHTFGFDISQVSGGDLVPGNNQNRMVFMNASSFLPAFASEGFEGAALPPPNWMILDYGGGNKWEKYFGGGYGNSARAVGYKLYSSWIGETDDLLLPPTQIGDPSKAKLFFDRAYTGKPGSDDSLFVLVSEDCGLTWKRAYMQGSSSMQTAPYTGNAQFDPLPNQWVTDTVSLAAAAVSSDVLIKFQIKSDQGCNLYLDNVCLKVDGVVSGTGEMKRPLLKLYPNPLSGNEKLHITTEQTALPQFSLLNVLGQMVQVRIKVDGSGLADCSLLPNGIYFLQWNEGAQIFRHKLVIAR